MGDAYRAQFKRGGWPEIYRMEIERVLRQESAIRKSNNGLAGLYHALALDNLWLGDKAKALEYLRRSLEAKTKFEEMNFTFPYAKVDPVYNDLRNDPAFHEFLRQIRRG